MALAVPRRSYVSARFDRAISTWLSLATGWTSSGELDGVEPLRIIRAGQGSPRPPLPYVSFQLVPGTQTNGRDSRNLSPALISATVTVTASAAGEWATLRANALRLAYQLAGGDTAADARDQLLAQLAASVEPIDGAAGAGAELTLTPQQPGELVCVAPVEGVTLDSSVSEIVQHAQGSRALRWRIQLHGFSDPLESDYIDMDSWADAIITSLTEQTTLDAMHALGVAHSGPRPSAQSVAVQSGGRVELRTFFDVFLSTWGDLARPVGPTADTITVAPIELA